VLEFLFEVDDEKNRADFIIAVMGKSNRCEIEGVWNLFPTPSLKLGSD